MHFRSIGYFFLFASLLAGCPTRKEGAITGTVVPPRQDVRVTALLQGNEMASTTANAKEGKFRIAIAPGTYDVNVSVPETPFPLVFPGVIVRAGETTVLELIHLAPPPAATAVIRGRIVAPGATSIVSLRTAGIERASVGTDIKGSYLFERLLPGSYSVEVKSPGYANDSRTISVLEGQQVSQDIRQLYITMIDGADWSVGILRARGIGHPPSQAPTPTVRREMSRRAAFADAERNLLRMIELVQVGPEQKLMNLIGEKYFTERMQGFLHGYRVAADRDLDGGRVEVELELPLTGNAGLTSYLSTR